MPSAAHLVEAVQKAHQGSLTPSGICHELDVLYETLMELKHRSPWHWKIVIRAIHGLISETKRVMGCP